MLKRLYPFSYLARVVDLNFANLDRLSSRIDALQAGQQSLAARQAELTEGLHHTAESFQRLQDAAAAVPANGDAAPVQSPAGGLRWFDSRIFRTPVDVVVTHNEANSMHGTGVLVQKLFGGSEHVVALRAVSSYDGKQSVGAAQFCLPELGLSRARIFAQVLEWIGGAAVKRVVAIPYGPDDLLLALAVKEIFDVPFCLYIMDDQNVFTPGIPDSLMEEAIDKARLCLMISPEMQYAYQNKFRRKMWLLPPVVSGELVRRRQPAASNGARARGALVGNVWSQRWLDLLRRTVRGSGAEIDWYSNNKTPVWLSFDRRELERDGIICCQALPEAELADRLQSYGFAVMPSGHLDDMDSHRSVAELSLPSRVPFITAAAQLPILVLGNRKVAAAQFVERFGVGLACDYEPDQFRRAVAEVTRPETQERMRENAWRIAPRFSDQGMGEWLWRSLELGEPCDRRFEELMTVRPGTFVYYQDPRPPEDLIEDFVPIYQSVARLKRLGYAPEFVLDIGASTGIWSDTVNRLYPEARFVLVDALATRYDEQSRRHFIDRHANFELVERAVSDRCGRMRFQISTDLYNSSLVHVNDSATVGETADVEVTTLDRLARERQITGRGMLKVDVQYAEHLIVAGGREFLAGHVDVAVFELTLGRVHPETRTLAEMLGMMSELGFDYFDDAGEWRDPATGRLEQKDIVFVRRGLLPPQ